jgi:nucleoid-associated protein YgaU
LTFGTAQDVLANYHTVVPIGGVPATHQGTLEVFELSARGDGTELNKVVVPIIFGRTLIDSYFGFSEYTVVPGDTLSGIAQHFYGDGALFPRIFEANRDQINNPDLISPGQVLRIPEGNRPQNPPSPA